MGKDDEFDEFSKNHLDLLESVLARKYKSGSNPKQRY